MLQILEFRKTTGPVDWKRFKGTEDTAFKKNYVLDKEAKSLLQAQLKEENYWRHKPRISSLKQGIITPNIFTLR